MNNNNTNNIPDLLRENSNRLFFLKAILLGIQYGESDKCSLYKKMVNDEIKRLEIPSSPFSNTPPSVLLKNPLPHSPATTAPPSLLTPSTLKPIQNPLKDKTENSIRQYSEILQQLQEQRIGIIAQLGNISSINYSKTLTLQQTQLNNQRINQLKALLAINAKEIEKYTLLSNSIRNIQLNPKFSSQESIMRKNNVKKYIDPSTSFNSNSTSTSNSIPITPSTTTQPIQLQINRNPFQENNNIINENDIVNDNGEENEDFMKELQKTFGSLSSLLLN